MRLIDDVYTYDIDEKKNKKILKRISRNKKIKKLFVVTFPMFSDGVLEIYSYNSLFQPYYKKHQDEICVVGYAKGKACADMLLLSIIQKMCDAGYKNFDSKDLRDFLL